MNPRVRQLRFCIVALVAAFGLSLPDPAAAEATHVTPPSAPTEVAIGLYLIGLTGVTEASSPFPTFEAEILMDLQWRDPRVAFGDGDERHFYLEHEAQEALDEMWWPDPIVQNEVHARQTEAQELIVYPDGRVVYEERFNVTVHAELDLRRFPLDRQRFELVIEPLAWTSHEVQLVPNLERTGHDADFRIPEWSVSAVTIEPGTRVEARRGREFSAVSLRIDAARASAHYLLRFLVPLAVVMALTLSVFWMPARDRGRVGFIALLTIVASHGVIASQLPRIAYLTFVDLILFIGYAYAAVLIVEATWVARLEEREDEASKQRAALIDRRTRWMLPAAGLAAIAAAAIGISS